MKKYKDKWYKVWFKHTLIDGNEYSLFEYAFGNKQVKRLVEKLNAYKVTEWTIYQPKRQPRRSRGQKGD